MQSNQPKRGKSIWRCPVCGNSQSKVIVSNVRENLRLIGGRYSYCRCQSCKVISQQPLPSLDLLANYYNLIDQSCRDLRTVGLPN